MMSQRTVLVFADVFALEPQLLGPGNSENISKNKYSTLTHHETRTLDCDNFEQ
jgi:hypothetical protein